MGLHQPGLLRCGLPLTNTLQKFFIVIVACLPLCLGDVPDSADGVGQQAIWGALSDRKPRVVEYKPGRLLLVFAPSGTSVTPQPAALFIHGRGWGGGDPNLFVPHARHYATRGLVGVSVGYRLAGEGGTGSTPFDCVADVKSAIRCIRAHAAELGVDPHRIAVLTIRPAVTWPPPQRCCPDLMRLTTI